MVLLRIVADIRCCDYLPNLTEICE